MNPFTQFLRQWSGDKTLNEFVAHWDKLEKLVIRIYRAGQATAADETEYRQTRAWLQQNYGKLERQLRPYWQQSLVGGRLAQGDPFRFLVKAPQAAEFVGHWQAMQSLPAAREALNQRLVDIGQD